MNPQGRPGWPRVVLGPAAALAAAAALATLYTPRAEHLDEAELARATQHLDAALPAAKDALTAALWPEEQKAVAELAALQVGAAEMALAGIAWEDAPSEDFFVQALDLRLEAIGPADNVPILIDGLTQQARPCLVRALWVRADGALVRVGVQLRFFRPGQPSTTAQTPAEAALLAAQRLEQIEGFAALIPSLTQRAAQNAALVRIALPGLLRGVPTSPRGWLGLDLSQPRPELLMDPEGL